MSDGQKSVSSHPTQIICKTKFQLCRRGNFICRGRKQTISQPPRQTDTKQWHELLFSFPRSLISAWDIRTREIPNRHYRNAQ